MNKGFNFYEFKSGGLNEKHAVAAWSMEAIPVSEEYNLLEYDAV
jgi:hypothetical protein